MEMTQEEQELYDEIKYKEIDKRNKAISDKRKKLIIAKAKEAAMTPREKAKKRMKKTLDFIGGVGIDERDY